MWSNRTHRKKSGEESEESIDESEKSKEQSGENDADGNGNRYFLNKYKSKWLKFPNNRHIKTRSDNITIYLLGVKRIARQKNRLIVGYYFYSEYADDIVRYMNAKLATKALAYFYKIIDRVKSLLTVIN